jgi:hypothetical protein
LPPAHAGVEKGLPSLLLTGLCEFICIVKTSLAVYGGARDEVRLAAASVVLDRAYGKPAQSQDINFIGDLHIESMSDRQLSALVERLGRRRADAGFGGVGTAEDATILPPSSLPQ